MVSLQVKGHVDADGLLTLRIPTALRETDVEALLVLKPVTSPKSAETDTLGWPPDFFTKIAGSISDDTFQRWPQSEYETREEF